MGPWDDDDDDEAPYPRWEPDPNCLLCLGEGGWREGREWVECPDCFPEPEDADGR